MNPAPRRVCIALTAMMAALAMRSSCTPAPAAGDVFAIFAVGFTSVVDGGARLVFTTMILYRPAGSVIP